MKQSPELTAFYNDYNNWLEAGAPEKNEYNFTREQGLCHNIMKWSNICLLNFDTITDEMCDQFNRTHLNQMFPFGFAEFFDRKESCSQHLDPNRIKWVKAHLTEEVDEKFELV